MSRNTCYDLSGTSEPARRLMESDETGDRSEELAKRLFGQASLKAHTAITTCEAANPKEDSEHPVRGDRTPVRDLGIW